MNPKPYVIEKREVRQESGIWGPWELLMGFRTKTERDNQLQKIRLVGIWGIEHRGAER